MDDMLRTAVRRFAFDFEAASKQIQGYVARLRTCGGVLPKEVVAELYTADVCRMRWTQLDLLACKLYRACASGERACEVPASSGAPALAGCGSQNDASSARTPTRDDVDGTVAAASAINRAGESGDDDSDDGIVDLNALRAKRLGGLFGVPAASREASKQRSEPKESAKADADRVGSREALRARPHALGPTLPSSGRSLACGRNTVAAAGVGRGHVGIGRDHASQLEELAATLAATADGRSPPGGVLPSGANAHAAQELLPPLTDLQQRSKCERLEALPTREGGRCSHAYTPGASCIHMADMWACQHRCVSSWRLRI